MRGRDRFVDLLRGGSILAVVLGHWLVADLRWDGRQLVDTSSLVEVPAMWPVTWLFLVIPVFFFVGGYANLRSWEGTLGRGEGYASFVDRRLHRMLAPTGVYLALACAAGVLVRGMGGLGVGGLGGLPLQSLWFLGAYLWVVALAPLTLRLHRRWGAGVLVVLGALVVLGDVGRFALDLSAAGYLNVLWVWLLMHQLGYWYAEARIGRRAAVAMAAGGLTATVALVVLPAYPETMVGVPGVTVGNMHPPTLAVTCLGIAQIGACLLLRGPLTRWMTRPRPWRAVVAVNLTILTIYLWHQVALILAARLVLPLGWPRPQPGTPSWWLAHLAFLAVPSALLAGIVAVLGRAEQVRPPRPIAAGRATAAWASLGVVLVGIGMIDLAGSSVLELLGAGERLGPVTATTAQGLALVAAGALLLAVLRRRAPAAGPPPVAGPAAADAAPRAAGPVPSSGSLPVGRDRAGPDRAGPGRMLQRPGA